MKKSLRKRWEDDRSGSYKKRLLERWNTINAGNFKKIILERFQKEHGDWRQPLPPLTRSVSLAPTIPDEMVDMFLDIDFIPKSTETLRDQQLEPNESVILLNAMMEAINSIIRWEPPKRELDAKLKDEPNYAARTADFTPRKLKRLVRLLRKWIKGPLINPSANKILVVDFMNLLYFKPIAALPANIKYKVIEYILKKCMNDEGYNRIIICVQNNELHNPKFRQLMINLREFLGNGHNSVLIMPGHNRSSMDDLFVILSCEILKQEGLLIKSGVLTGDMYADFINNEMIKIFIKTYCEQHRRDIEDFIRKTGAEKDIEFRQMMNEKMKYLNETFGYRVPLIVRPSISGAPRSGSSISGAPRSGPSISGPSRIGNPISGPSRRGPLMRTPSMSGPSRSGPPMSGPSRSGPSMSGPSRSGPPMSGPSRSGPSMSGPSRSGPSRRGGGTVKYKKSLLNKRTRRI
jgi:hypothetical protein